MDEAASHPSVRLAERLMGMSATREVITPDTHQSVRWHQHDYPSPVARWNHHPEYEVHLIRKGTGSFIIGDHIGTFEAGHVSLIGSGLPHDWISDLQPGEQLAKRDAVVHFDRTWVDSCAQLMPELAEMRSLLDRSIRGIEFTGQTALDAAQAIEAMGETSGLHRLHHLIGLFSVLAGAPRTEHRYLSSVQFHPQLDPQEAAVVDMVLNHVFTSHAGPLRMADAAKLAAMKGPTFSRWFQRNTGQNFSDLVRKLRLAHARKLLEQTDRPVSSICHEVGFANLSNFNRQFRADVGMTPREFRNCRPCQKDV